MSGRINFSATASSHESACFTSVPHVRRSELDLFNQLKAPTLRDANEYNDIAKRLTFSTMRLPMNTMILPI